MGSDSMIRNIFTWELFRRPRHIASYTLEQKKNGSKKDTFAHLFPRAILCQLKGSEHNNTKSFLHILKKIDAKLNKMVYQNSVFLYDFSR